MKVILVTGATGFLGRHLIEQLRRSDARLRILCRSAAPWEQETGFEIFCGDVVRRDHVRRAAEGVQEIYHLAGMVSRDPRDAERLFRTHVEGTRHVLDVALEHGVEKVLVVSSSGTIAVSREPVVRDETAGYPYEVIGAWPYYLSKVYEEKLALEYFAQRRLPVVVVNPSLLLGPGDDRGSSTRDVALFLEGQILAVPRGGLSFVDVRDAAAGTIAAMERGRPGERYLLGGVNWSFRELIETVARISGRRAPRLEPSLQTSLRGARWLRRLYRLAGKSFKLDDASIQMSACFWYCDSTKAKNELGFRTRDPLETLKDTVEDVLQRLGSQRR